MNINKYKCIEMNINECMNIEYGFLKNHASIGLDFCRVEEKDIYHIRSSVYSPKAKYNLIIYSKI